MLFSRPIARLWHANRPPLRDRDPIRLQAAKALFSVVVAFVLIGLPFLAVVLPLFVARKLAVAGLWTLLSAALVASLWRLRAGHIRSASWIVLSTLWAILAGVILTTGGMSSPGLFAPLAVIMIGGCLLGRRVAARSAFVFIGFVLALALLERAGMRLAPYFPNLPLAVWAMLTLFVAIIVLPLSRVLDALHRTLAQTRRRVDALLSVQQALRASEERYRAVVETSPDAITMTDCAGIVVMCNRRAAEMHGYGSPAELCGLSAFDLIAEPDRERASANMLRAADDGAIRDVEYLLRRKDGSAFPGELSACLVYDGGGRPSGFMAITRDVTSRNRVEEALRLSEERYRSVVDSAMEWIWETNRDGVCTFSSPAAAITGYRPEELLGTVLRDSLSEEDRVLVARRRPTSENRGWKDWEVRWRHKDGSYRHFLSSALPILDSNGEFAGYRGVNLDVTGHRRLEEQYREAQKMESVGRLAGGIAHDFNNLLTIVNGYSELILKQVAPGDPVHGYVYQIARAGERAAALTQQLLAFGRRQITQPRLLDLNSLVLESKKMLAPLIGEDIELVTDLSPSLGCVMADPGQIDQVLVNLAVNARDAMPRGGTLRIGTADTAVSEAEAAEHSDALPGAYVRLSVSDTGMGMDEGTLAHIFEPFFTTKPKGSGTGLGLATVYGIVRQGKGWIAVSSRPGEGTSFHIHLPRAEAAAAAAAAGSA